MNKYHHGVYDIYIDKAVILHDYYKTEFFER